MEDPLAEPTPPGLPPERAAPPLSPLAAVGWSAATFVAFLAAQLAAIVVLQLLTAPAPGLALAVATLAGAPAGLLVIAAALRRRPGAVIRSELGLVLPRKPRLSSVLAAAAALAAFTVAYEALSRRLGRPVVPEFMLSAYRTAGWLPALYLGVVVAAPVFEELLFRGLLLSGLRRSPLGPPGAALLTAAAFALPHVQYDLYDVAAVFVLGVFLAAVRLRTGSTLLTIALHAAGNLVALIEVARQIGRGG